MIIDINGIILIPGNKGKNCNGNGKHKDENGNLIELCCDECDYYLKCYRIGKNYIKIKTNDKKDVRPKTNWIQRHIYT